MGPAEILGEADCDAGRPEAGRRDLELARDREVGLPQPGSPSHGKCGLASGSPPPSAERSAPMAQPFDAIAGALDAAAVAGVAETSVGGWAWGM